ncbi:MAG: hypothetical protein ACFFCD_00035 [Promethearchaeota archaeon]
MILTSYPFFRELKKKNKAILLIVLILSGLSISATYFANGKNSFVRIDDFNAEYNIEPCVGDPIDFFASISNIGVTHISVSILVKEKVDDKTETVIFQKTITLTSFESQKIEFRHIVSKGGNHKFLLYYVIDGEEFFGDSITIGHVKSYKHNTQFIVTYFHFNIQFRCGDKDSENRIINGSIRNLLDFYHKNPEYKFSFEIQGYAIEKMATEFPDLLQIIYALTRRGQMELIVTHYSDQFFIAYPELDLRKSIEISDNILKANEIRRSNVFGTQEWQWSPVLPEIMNDYNYNIFVGRESSFRKYTETNEKENHYQKTCVWRTGRDKNSVYVVLDGEASIYDEQDDTKSLWYKWAHHDDGEVVNTRGNAWNFEYDADKQARFERQLKRFKRENYKFLTISELVYTTLEKGLGTHELNEIPCTNQGNVWRWTGQKILEWEQDTYINTLRYKARTCLLALETVIDFAEKRGIIVEDEKKIAEEQWKELLLAEVTDSTGWQPREVEVDYSIEKAVNVSTLCERSVNRIINKLYMKAIKTNIDPHLPAPSIIDTKNLEITRFLPQVRWEEANSPIDFNVHYKKYTYTCYKSKNFDNLYLLEISVDPAEHERGAISFDLFDGLIYSPLATNNYNNCINLEKFSNERPYLMPANGWVYIGKNTSIVNICSTRHVPIRVFGASVYFQEEKTNIPFTYQFLIYFGTKENGLELANRVNVYPCVLTSDLTKPIITQEIISEFH